MKKCAVLVLLVGFMLFGLVLVSFGAGLDRSGIERKNSAMPLAVSTIASQADSIASLRTDGPREAVQRDRGEVCYE